MGGKKRFRLYVNVGTDQGPLSSTWHLWAHRTSFYLTNADLGGLKVSLHGVDPRHPSGGHFRVEPDPRSGKGIKEAPALGLLPPRDGWPLHFPGVSQQLGVLAIRIRVTPEACALPDALTRVPRRASSARVTIPRPLDGWAADLDLVFGQIPEKFEPSSPYPDWVRVGIAGSTLQVGQHESGFTIHNEHGAVLRAAPYHRRLQQTPTPDSMQCGAPEGVAVGRRAVQFDVAPDGVLWIVEQVDSKPGQP
ncbi:hypothetical protein GCM10028784_36920 [Myceligenerans cantabricum]